MDSRLVKHMEENMIVKTNEDLLTIWKKHDASERSDQALESVRNLPTECGIEVTQHNIPRGHFLGNNEELDNYVMRAQGISRKRLNILCSIGIFIFGWLLAVAFDQLGKKGKGWLYLVPLIFLIAGSHRSATDLSPIALLIYIVGWIHANIVLSRYKSLAKQRISEIDQNQKSLQTADLLLERGLLKAKVLCQTDQALIDFTNAFQLSGGDSRLLNLAGIQFCGAKRFTEAKQFFNRALATAKDETLVKQIKKNLTFAEKRLK